MNRNTHRKTFRNPPLGLLLHLVLLYGLFVDVIGSSDDITNIWYYGCRWFGGNAMTLQCNCTPEAEEMYIQRHSIAAFDIITIEINHCPQVRFGSYSVYDLRNLRTITLNNIGALTLEPNSLNWLGYRDSTINQEERFDLSIPSLKISIKNTRITNVASYTFVGRINQILFQNATVDTVEAFAFSNILQMEHLQFVDVRLRDVRTQAFKKFGTEFVTFQNVSADYLPSRTLSNVTVYRVFAIKGCNFHTLRPGTFIVNAPANFVVRNNRVEQLEGEAFLVTTTGDVVFRDNEFNNVQYRAFWGITLDNQIVDSRSITFDSNTFGQLELHSLDVQPQFKVKVSDLRLNQTCNCENIVDNLKLTEFYDEIHCPGPDGLYVTVKDFKATSCSILTGYYEILVVVCVSVMVICLLGIGCYVYYMMVYRRAKYGCEKAGKAPLSLIVPDGRTYKETELHVIVEKADLLTTDL